MTDKRVILHSDMNSFYASVEMMLDPSLKGKAVAVCGATEERHGIVLAKSDLAKKAGVKTGIRRELPYGQDRRKVQDPARPRSPGTRRSLCGCSESRTESNQKLHLISGGK